MKILYICVFLVLVSHLQFCKSEDSDEEDIDNISDSQLYRPKGMSRDEWARCRGVPCEKWQRIQLKLFKLRKLRKEINPDNDEENTDTEYHNPEMMSDIAIQNMEVEDDEMTSEEELDYELALLTNKTKTNRHKRNFLIVYLNQRQFFKNPIFYRFDGTHNSKQRKFIHEAMKHIEEQTCYRFKDVTKHRGHRQSPLVFTASGRGCWSWVGYRNGQNVNNLNPACFFAGKGVPVHEMLHALGLFHEQSRADRDRYININLWGLEKLRSQFSTRWTNTDIRFDVNSIMMYSAILFQRRVLSLKGQYGKLYEPNFGLRHELSFYNSKAINLKLCTSSCRGRPLRTKCLRNGYQDPLDCTRCRCPPGFAGRLCENISPSVNMKCGGSFTVSKRKPFILKFPEGNMKYYPIGVKCYWYFKSADTSKLNFQFEGMFSVGNKIHAKCSYHYVEVIFKKGLDSAGPRFCGLIPSSTIITTDGPELMVVLNSILYASQFNRKGFRVKITAAGAAKRRIHSTTLQIPTKRLTTARRTTLRPTTLRPTRRTTKTVRRTTTLGPPWRTHSTPKRRITSFTNKFWCSFEQGNHQPEECGIKQLKDDQFDWRPGTGHPISRYTGPRRAHSGSYYLYVDSRYTRARDKARLELPTIPRKDKYCICIWYYMYGRDINNLKLLMWNPKTQTSKMIWKRDGNYMERWRELFIRAYVTKGTKFIIQAEMHSRNKGDIAIDDISIKRCTF